MEIHEILVYHSGLEASVITPESLLTKIGLDSIDISEIMLHIEDEIEVTITPDEWASLKTVKDLADKVESKRARSSTG
jgi:acyl carrier protein